MQPAKDLSSGEAPASVSLSLQWGSGSTCGGAFGVDGIRWDRSNNLRMIARMAAKFAYGLEDHFSGRLQ